MRLFLKHMADKIIIYRSIKIALFIGIILAMINHYDEIINGELTNTNILQILLTFTVPYFVSSFSSALHARHVDMKK